MSKRKQKPKPRKHLTLEERAVMENMLNQGEPVSQIARCLGRPVSTIIREIKRHMTIIPLKGSDCDNYHNCRKRHVCGDKNCTGKCRLCSKCSIHCSDYTKHQCTLKTSSPYVCNSCTSKHLCKNEKHFYYANAANSAYRSILSDSRSGFSLSEEEMKTLDAAVSPMLKKGISPYHILLARPDLNVSESTLRRMISSCVLTGRNIDLRTQVKRKIRNSPNRNNYKENISVNKAGHTYEDFLRFQSEHDYPVVEMDCVEGKKEDKAVLLTLHFVKSHMQLAFIMDEHNSKNVVATLDKIELTLGKELFQKAFPLILTDNGHEFTDISGMERSIYGGKRTTVYFCEPCRSDQKGHCEKNHTHIRYVIPKGHSLEPFTQKDISLMMDHINSYYRKSLHGKCPYDVARIFFPQDFFLLLGLETVPSDKICLKPSLLQKHLSK